jgi:hypothetical protein
MKIAKRLKIWWRGEHYPPRLNPAVAWQPFPSMYLDPPSRRDRSWAAMHAFQWGTYLAGIITTVAAMAIAKWLGLT